MTALSARKPYKNIDFARFLMCPPFYVMLLLLVEAALSASTTWLIIKAGQHVAEEEFLIADLLWIVAVQSTAYVVGAVSWVFAERAGFGAFGRYMMRFARDNKQSASLLGDKQFARQQEPFLTNETFHIFFELMFELEADLKLFFGLIFNCPGARFCHRRRLARGLCAGVCGADVPAVVGAQARRQSVCNNQRQPTA